MEGGGRHHRMAPLALVATLVAAVLALTSSCRKGDTDALWSAAGAASVGADSIRLADGTSLRALSDSCLLVRRAEGSTFTITASAHDGERMAVKSEWPLFDLLLRLEQQYDRSAGYSYLTPLALYLNPLPARESAEALASRVKNGYVVPAETRLYLWPVINNDALWLLAATELARLHNDPRWIDMVISTACNASRLDRSVAYNPETGLIGGMPRYMLPAVSELPHWLTGTDLFSSASLTVNMAYVASLRNIQSLANDYARRNERLELPEMGLDADTLSRAILRNMWLPSQGIFSGLLYGSGNSFIRLHSADNIGQSIAVISRTVNPAFRSSVITNTPVSSWGAPLLSPRTGAKDSALPPPLVRMLRTLWAVATSKVPEAAERYDEAVGQLLAAVALGHATGEDTYADPGRPVESLILRGFLGAEFQADGTRFAPSVPAGMAGDLIVTGLRIRRARLNVIVRGSGSRIVACSLDGAPASPFIASSVEGEHTLEIAVAPAEECVDTRSLATVQRLPSIPVAHWVKPMEAQLEFDSSDNDENGTSVYVNGMVSDEFAGNTYTIPDSPSARWIQFASVTADGIPGIATSPHVVLPKGSVIAIPLADVTKGGTRIIDDRATAKRFVESNRWKNRTLHMEVDIPQEGDYLIDMRYIHGLGLVNARRRTALRRLEVNSANCGILVFPQLSKGSGSAPEGWKEWQRLTSYTNPLRARLHKGVNVIEVKFWQPSPVFVSPDANVVLADRLRLIRL